MQSEMNYFSIPILQREINVFIKGFYNQQNKIYGSGALITENFDTIGTISLKGNDPKYTSDIIGEIRACTAAILWAEKNNIRFTNIIFSNQQIENWILSPKPQIIENEYDFIKSNFQQFALSPRTTFVTYNGYSYFNYFFKRLFNQPLNGKTQWEQEVFELAKNITL